MFVVAIIQSFLTASELRQFYVEGLSPLGYYWTIVPVFVLGSCVLAWLSDEMTDFGLGNGSACSSPCPCVALTGTRRSTTRQPYSRRRWNRSSRSLVPDWRSSRAASWSRRERARCRCCTSRARPSPGPAARVRKDVDHIPFKVNPLGVQPVLVAVFMCDGFMWLNKILDPPGFIRAATEFLFSNAASPMY